LIGDLNTPHGKNSPRLPPTGFPAIIVSIRVRARRLASWASDPRRRMERATLVKIVYGYEQATRHRHPPASTPPLPAR
jgi:hypothetical protein